MATTTTSTKPTAAASSTGASGGTEKKAVGSPEFGPKPPKVNRDDPLPPGPPSMWPDPEKRAEVVKKLKEEKKQREDAEAKAAS